MKHPRLKAALLIAFLAEQATMVMLIIFHNADEGMRMELLSTLKATLSWRVPTLIGIVAVLFFCIVHAVDAAREQGAKEEKRRQNDRVAIDKEVAMLTAELEYEISAHEHIERSHVPLLDFLRAWTKAAEADAKLKESFVAPTLDSVER